MTANVQFFGTLKSYEVSASGLGNPPRIFDVSETDLETFLRVLIQNNVAEINIRYTPTSIQLDQPSQMFMDKDPTLTTEGPLWKAGVHQEPSPNQCCRIMGDGPANLTGHGSDGEGQ